MFLLPEMATAIVQPEVIFSGWLVACVDFVTIRPVS